MKQIYHHYTKWECYKNNMWVKATQEEKENLLPAVIEFTGDHQKYGAAMNDVINNWHFTLEHHLTDTGINRLAFLGHAACNFKFGWNEEIVRIAWGKLTEMQMKLANDQAAWHIKIWEQKHKNSKNKSIGQLTLF